MPTIHPATVLLAWAGGVLCLPFLATIQVTLLAAVACAASLVFAASRMRSLLRRARWLLLSLAVLFAFFTPGLRLPGLAGELGLTEDGLLAALEHLSRLLGVLATLALVHEALGSAGFLAGLHWLLAPLSPWRGLRERIVVRLALVLEFVESSPVGGWREWMSGSAGGPATVTTSVRVMHWLDWLIWAVVIGTIGSLLAW